jgi:catechol 2,3-dioxygenase-like lactoylglutathione lyase family enzyme
MFARVTITASDLAASRRFYDALLGEGERRDFSLAEGEPTRHLHVAFGVRSRADVDERWRRVVDMGYAIDGEPGPRPQYSDTYYGGFLLDPDGNSAEVVHGVHPYSPEASIDHLWLGVRDVEESRRFWEAATRDLDVRVVDASRPGLVSVTNGYRHLILVADGRPATENVGISLAGPHGVAVEVL